MRCDITGCNGLILSTIIDGYERCHQRKLPSMPSHERMIYHPDDSGKDLRWDTDYSDHGQWSMHLELEIWRRDHFGMFLVTLFSFLLFFRYRPSTNGVGTCFYHLWSQSSVGGLSLCARSAKWSSWAVPIGSRTHDFVRLRTQSDCIILLSLFFSLLWFRQPRRSGPKKGDCLTAALNPGRVLAILNNRLAMSLRYPVIIYPLHKHLLSLTSTFATISYNHYMCACEAECWFTCPYPCDDFAALVYTENAQFK